MFCQIIKFFRYFFKTRVDKATNCVTNNYATNRLEIYTLFAGRINDYIFYKQICKVWIQRLTAA